MFELQLLPRKSRKGPPAFEVRFPVKQIILQFVGHKRHDSIVPEPSRPHAPSRACTRIHKRHIKPTLVDVIVKPRIIVDPHTLVFRQHVFDQPDSHQTIRRVVHI